MSDPERGARGTWEYLGWWRDGALDLAQTLRWLPADDLAAALLISAERPGELHCVTHSGTWYIWDGRCHAPDESDRAARLVFDFAERATTLIDRCRRESAVRIAARAGAETPVPELRRLTAEAWKPWEAAAKYLAGLRRTAGHSALLKALAAVRGTDGADLDDQHPEWLNFANGTVDLRTGKLRPHDPADMITYCLGTRYVPGARCPRFAALGRRMCGGDEDVFRFLMTLLGYALIGDNREQLIIFIDGPTKSGKSQLLEVVTDLLGALGHESQAALITLVRHGRNARTMNSIRGRRVIRITETSAFMVIDEGQVKMITGEASISVDQHYAKTEIRTPVTWLIFVATNEMPSLTNLDPAMRERVLVIPGGPTIPAGERTKRMAGIIAEEEAEGVLASLVGAAVHYFSHGLHAPLAVQMKTAQFAAEQDTVGNFLRDCCVVVPPGTPGLTVSTGQHDLWERYRTWARGSTHLGRTQFMDQMARQPGVKRNETSRRFEGICWTEEESRRFP